MTPENAWRVYGCNSCKHLGDGAVCKAFPDMIPIAIASGQVDHFHRRPGDRGITYEPRADIAALPDPR